MLYECRKKEMRQKRVGNGLHIFDDFSLSLFEPHEKSSKYTIYCPHSQFPYAWNALKRKILLIIFINPLQFSSIALNPNKHKKNATNRMLKLQKSWSTTIAIAIP